MKCECDLFTKCIACRLSSFIHQNQILPRNNLASLKKESIRISLLGGITDFIIHFYNFNKHAGTILFDIEKPHNTGLMTYFIRLSHFAYMIIFFVFLKSSKTVIYCPPQ